MCALRCDQGIATEFKEDETSEAAIKKLLKKKYHQGLTDISNLSEKELKDFLRINISLNGIGNWIENLTQKQRPEELCSDHGRREEHVPRGR